MFPLEVKHLLTAESIWKERTSLQRLKTMAAAIKHKKHTAGTPASLRRGLATPPTRLLDNTEHAVLLDRQGVFLNHLRPKKKTENPILPQTRNKQPEEETSKDRSADQSYFPRLVVVAGQRKWADRRDSQQTLRDQLSGGTRRKQTSRLNRAHLAEQAGGQTGVYLPHVRSWTPPVSWK